MLSLYIVCGVSVFAFCRVFGVYGDSDRRSAGVVLFVEWDKEGEYIDAGGVFWDGDKQYSIAIFCIYCSLFME